MVCPGTMLRRMSRLETRHPQGQLEVQGAFGARQDSPSKPVTRSSRWVTVLGCTCRAAAVSLRLPPLANHASSVATRLVPRWAS